VLRSDAEGILADLVFDAREWFDKGLGAPAEIKESRQEWRDESDQIQRFFRDRCRIDKTDPNLEAPATPLYDAYKLWCQVTREPEGNVVTQTRFGRELKRRGFPKHKPGAVMVYAGIALRNDPFDAA
jgi:phage/plasmid-associated DNA primase